MNRIFLRAQGNPATLERYVIPNLRNASRVMKLLAQSSGGCRATDIARALDVPGTTTLRIMATLQLEGLVRTVKGRFVLGPALIPLADASLACSGVHSALPAASRETAALRELPEPDKIVAAM